MGGVIAGKFFIRLTSYHNLHDFYSNRTCWFRKMGSFVTRSSCAECTTFKIEITRLPVQSLKDLRQAVEPVEPLQKSSRFQFLHSKIPLQTSVRY